MFTTSGHSDHTIRAARPSDLAELDALFARSYPRLMQGDYPPSMLVTALPRIARAQPALLASGTYYVAVQDGRIVGAGGYSVRAPGPEGKRAKGRGNVRHVVTDDRLVRQGIGRAVMVHTMTKAKAAGLTWLHCVSTRTGVPFYGALGFQRIGEISVPLAPGIDFPGVEMWRAL